MLLSTKYSELKRFNYVNFLNILIVADSLANSLNHDS